MSQENTEVRVHIQRGDWRIGRQLLRKPNIIDVRPDGSEHVVVFAGAVGREHALSVLRSISGVTVLDKTEDENR